MRNLRGESRACPRCGRRTTARGGRSPRFCAVCGQALDQPAAARPVEFPPPPAPPAVPASAGVAPLAVAALVLGICAFVPGCGVVPAVLAIIMGNVARKRIDAAGRVQGGRPLATAGVVLGTLAVLVQALVCLGVR